MNLNQAFPECDKCNGTGVSDISFTKEEPELSSKIVADDPLCDKCNGKKFIPSYEAQKIINFARINGLL